MLEEYGLTKHMQEHTGYSLPTAPLYLLDQRHNQQGCHTDQLHEDQG